MQSVARRDIVSDLDHWLEMQGELTMERAYCRLDSYTVIY